MRQSPGMRRVLGYAGVGLSFFASGLIVGLGLIAASVKFTAPRPEILDLLDVGRVQFAALHVAEWILIPCACLALWIGTPPIRKAIVVTFGCFLVQALAIQPSLHARMVDRLAERPVGESSLHLVYVFVATALSLFLMVQGWLGIRALAEATRDRGVSTEREETA